jgi:hypothetical protein
MDQTAGLLGIFVLPREGPLVATDTRTHRVLGEFVTFQTLVFESFVNDPNNSNNFS